MTTHPARHDLVEALRAELNRMVEHFGTWANDRSDEATTETWGALHCARETLRRAALASEAASQVPADGWVMVPKEPTETMLSAIARADWMGKSDLNWADGYRIMIAAAPDQEGPADGK